MTSLSILPERTEESIRPDMYDSPDFIFPYNAVTRLRLGDDNYISPLSRKKACIPSCDKAWQGVEVNHLRTHEIRLMTDTINRLMQQWNITKSQMHHIMAGLKPEDFSGQQYQEARDELMSQLDLVLVDRYQLTIRMALTRWFLGPQVKFDQDVTVWMHQNCYTLIQNQRWDHVRQQLLAYQKYTELEVLAISPFYIKRYWENTVRKKIMRTRPA